MHLDPRPLAQFLRGAARRSVRRAVRTRVTGFFASARAKSAPSPADAPVIRMVSGIAASQRGGRYPFSQPPVNPALSNPRRRCGFRRIVFQIRPVR